MGREPTRRKKNICADSRSFLNHSRISVRGPHETEKTMLNLAHQNRRRLLAFALLSFLLIPLSSLNAQNPAPGPDSTHHDPGSLDARDKDGKELGRFPLQHTKVESQISGFLNRVTVTQYYTNPF